MPQAENVFFIVKTQEGQDIKSTFNAAQNYALLKLKQGAEWVDVFQVTRLSRQYAAPNQTGSNPRVRKGTSKPNTRRTTGLSN